MSAAHVLKQARRSAVRISGATSSSTARRIPESTFYVCCINLAICARTSPSTAKIEIQQRIAGPPNITPRTKEALASATKHDARIVLIDGEKLATRMIDHGLGVTLEAGYEVKRIDAGSFAKAQTPTQNPNFRFFSG